MRTFLVPFISLVLTSASAPAQVTRVSVASDGNQANGASYSPAMSGDGRFVAFCSTATNLVPGDTNGMPDVFVHDRQTGVTELVSIAFDGGASSSGACPGSTSRVAVSDDGRFVAFESSSFNLLAPDADSNGVDDVFLRDRLLRTTVRVSVSTGGVQRLPSRYIIVRLESLSADGRKIVMYTWPPVPFEQTLPPGYFVHDADTLTTTPLSPAGLRCRAREQATPDLRFVIFGETRTDGECDVVIWDRTTDARRVQRAGGEPLAISADGQLAVMQSEGGVRLWNTATGITLGLGTDGAVSPEFIDVVWMAATPYVLVSGRQVSVINGLTGTGHRVDLSGTGADPLPAVPAMRTVGAALSADGRFVAFESYASNLLGTGLDTNDVADIYVRDAFDDDGDGLPSEWESSFGLDPFSAAGVDGASADLDGDGLTNAQEYAAQGHPDGRAARYFAEGAQSGFFSTRLALFNPDATIIARVQVRFMSPDGTTATRVVTLDPLGRTSLDGLSLAAYGLESFATEVTSNMPIVAERTMSWDAAQYGSHAETGLPAPAATWYFAEGATHSGFNLFYLLQNPNDEAVDVTVRYLRPFPLTPVTRTYRCPPRSRQNIWVDAEGADLENTDVSAVITAGLPILVERAMYLDRPGQAFGAGHASAGISAPATEWFLAEGATGDFFDLFILIANPAGTDAAIRATFLLPDGATVVKFYTAHAGSRLNLWVDREDSRLADTAVATVITSTNGVPLIVERAMWWPGPTAATWAEAHSSAGVTSPAARWGLAGEWVGGWSLNDVYLLVANRGAPVTVRVTAIGWDGTRTRFLNLPAESRTTIDVGREFPAEAAWPPSRSIFVDMAFIVETVDGSPQIVVERSVYTSRTGWWTAGTNLVATPLPD